MEKGITFTRHSDGRVTVDRWMSEIVIAAEFLELCPLALDFPAARLTVDGDHVRFVVSNGSATYRIVERRPDYGPQPCTMLAVLVESEGPHA